MIKPDLGSEWKTIEDAHAENGIEIQMKNSVITQLPPEHKLARKARQYFERLQSINLFNNWVTLDKYFVQNLFKGNERQSFIQVQKETDKGSTYFINVTSNRSKTSTGINRRNWEDVNFVSITGMCLFGGMCATATTEDKSLIPLWDVKEAGTLNQCKIIEIDVNQSLTNYEKEKIERFASLINSLSGPEECLGRSYFILPKIQYYLYLFPAYDEGLISPELYKKWIKHVDERCEKLRELIDSRLNVKVVYPNNSLHDLRNALLTSIDSGKVLSLKEAKSIITQKSPLWKQYLEQRTFPIESWEKLVFCSYLISFLEVQQSLNSKEQLVHLDDQVEKVILRELARTQKKLGVKESEGPFLLGVYSLQSLVYNQSSKDSNLYTIKT